MTSKLNTAIELFSSDILFRWFCYAVGSGILFILVGLGYLATSKNVFAVITASVFLLWLFCVAQYERKYRLRYG